MPMLALEVYFGFRQASESFLIISELSKVIWIVLISTFCFLLPFLFSYFYIIILVKCILFLTIEPTEKSHKLLFSYPIYSIYDQQAKGLICVTVLLLNLYHFLAAFESKLNLTWIWKSFTMCSLAYL